MADILLEHKTNIMSCPFKNMFGEPGRGVHSMRIPGTDIALVDTVMTIAGAWLIHKIFKISFPWTLFVLFILGELMHYAFCVDTAVLNYFRVSM